MFRRREISRKCSVQYKSLVSSMMLKQYFVAIIIEYIRKEHTHVARGFGVKCLVYLRYERKRYLEN